MAKKKKAEFEHKTDGSPCPCEPKVISYAAPEPEARRKMSGDELKASLRQQRRDTRLAEKGY